MQPERSAGASMTKVLLVFSRPEKKGLFINHTPPIGLLSIAATLEANGFQTKVVDDKIGSTDLHEFDFVCFSVNCSNFVTVLKEAEKIKQAFPDKTIVVGGPQVNSSPEHFIKSPFVDVAIKGEGEKVFLEYLKAKDKRSVPGLFLKEGKSYVFTGESQRIEDLDALPFQALEKVNLRNYDVPIKKKKPITGIMTSRGCPYNCIFCFHSLGRKWVARSPKNVVDEIEWQVKRFGVKEICILDDNFTLDLNRAKEICDLIAQRKIKIKIQLMNGVRVDKLDKELLAKMKKAGVWLVTITPESGNLETLKKIKKGFDLKKAEQVVKWCKELGLNTQSCFMIGFPWETAAHIKNTIDFALKLDTDFLQISRVVPIPQTELFDMMGLNAEDYLSKEIGFFYGSIRHKVKGVSEEEILSLIKSAYRKFYLNPFKMLRLLRILDPAGLFKLFLYSIKTQSI